MAAGIKGDLFKVARLFSTYAAYSTCLSWSTALPTHTKKEIYILPLQTRCVLCLAQMPFCKRH